MVMVGVSRPTRPWQLGREHGKDGDGSDIKYLDSLRRVKSETSIIVSVLPSLLWSSLLPSLPLPLFLSHGLGQIIPGLVGTQTWARTRN